MKKQEETLKPGDVADDLGRAYARRGAIYRWLRDNHDFVATWLAEREPPWGEVAKRLAAARVVGARGNIPAGHAVRRVWKRVCRDVAVIREKEAAAAREREALAERRRSYPSRQGRDWRPGPALADAEVRAEGFGGGGGRLPVPCDAGRPPQAEAGGEGLVRHPIERQRMVPQRVMAGSELEAAMNERGDDGRLTPRAVELKMSWSRMRARRQDKWQNAPQGMLILDHEIILVRP